MNLAYKYPIVYWNTANLIVDSGGIQADEESEEEVQVILQENSIEFMNTQEALDEEEWEEANEEEDISAEDKKKKKEKVVDYGRIASIIGKMSSYGIKVSPPDINKSSFTFTPIAKDNIILYGLRGITCISTDKINEIMAMRPYESLKDFLMKIKVNKLQMINLIKSGAFDNIENIPREQIMAKYLDMIVDKKQRLTLQNMAMLIEKNQIPEEMQFYAKLFLFNKFLKTCKNGVYYELNESALNFIDTYFNIDIVENGTKVLQKTWDNIYKKAMEPMRVYLKEHKDEMLQNLNQNLYDELKNKYAYGNISSWEMESLSFYYHDHELKAFINDYDDFFALPEEPNIDYTFEGKGGQSIKIYKLNHIIGTVIDKNKIRNTVTLLTPTGAVNVKIYKNQFALYDKQLSVKDSDGTKHVIESSWFKRGSLLMVQGIRRGQDFIPKKYKNSVYPVISKIIEIDKNNLKFQFERMEV